MIDFCPGATAVQGAKLQTCTVDKDEEMIHNIFVFCPSSVFCLLMPPWPSLTFTPLVYSSSTAFSCCFMQTMTWVR
jgi:hypothetical protein